MKKRSLSILSVVLAVLLVIALVAIAVGSTLLTTARTAPQPTQEPPVVNVIVPTQPAPVVNVTVPTQPTPVVNVIVPTQPAVIAPTDVVPPTPVPPTPAAPQPQCYPLNGQQYSSPQGSQYDALWTCDGRLWQPSLPSGNLRVAHTVAVTLEVGEYAFDAVECALYVDASRNGQGANNPMTVGYGNDLHFSVETSDGGQAWALVDCRGNFSTGFQIRWLADPLP